MKLIATILLFANLGVGAQGLNKEEIRGAISSCDSSKSITYLSQLDEAASKLYWENTKDKTDHIEINVPDSYLDIISKFRVRASPVPRERQPIGRTFLPTAQFQESKNRVTLFYSVHGEEIMVTKWDFGLDNGRICVPEVFLNYSKGKVRGTVALATSRDKANTKALWKVRWVSADLRTQYELYVDDVRKGSSVGKTAQEIIQIAESLM